MWDKHGKRVNKKKINNKKKDDGEVWGAVCDSMSGRTTSQREMLNYLHKFSELQLPPFLEEPHRILQGSVAHYVPW